MNVVSVSLLCICDQLHQYKYYSTGLLSTHDPFYEQHRHLLGTKKKKIKDEKKLKGTIITKPEILNISDMLVDCFVYDFVAKLKKVKKKKKRGEGDLLDEGIPYVPKIFAKFSHDAPLPASKKKHLTVEQLNARRRKVWLTIAKKEIPKVSAGHSSIFTHTFEFSVSDFSPDYPFFASFSPSSRRHQLRT